MLRSRVRTGYHYLTNSLNPNPANNHVKGSKHTVHFVEEGCSNFKSAFIQTSLYLMEAFKLPNFCML